MSSWPWNLNFWNATMQRRRRLSANFVCGPHKSCHYYSQSSQNWTLWLRPQLKGNWTLRSGVCFLLVWFAPLILSESGVLWPRESSVTTAGTLLGPLICVALFWVIKSFIRRRLRLGQVEIRRHFAFLSLLPFSSWFSNEASCRIIRGGNESRRWLIWLPIFPLTFFN